jgi:hypothetical protein
VALLVDDYRTALAHINDARDAIGIAAWRIEHELAERAP